MATYYVSTTGSNGYTGLDTDHPWQTLAYAETHAITAGDIIALKKGDTWASTTAVAIKHGGTSINHIIWDGGLWGSGAHAIIQSSADRSSGNDAIVNIITCNYLTFQNITVDGNSKACYGLIVGGHSGFSGNNQSTGISESYIIIQDCSILNCGDSGDVYRNALQVNPFLGDCDSITIQRCSFDGATNHTLAIYPERSADGGTHQAATNCYIGYNTLTNFGLKKNGVAAGIMIVNQVTTCIIEHNTIIGTSNGDGMGICLDCNETTAGHYPTGITVRFNDVKTTNVIGYACFAISSNAAATTVSTQVDCYYNKFYSTYTGYSDGGGIYIYEGSGTLTSAILRFYNNTIVTEGGTNIKDQSGRAGILTIKNNIFINRGTYGDTYNLALWVATTTLTHVNNVYYKTDHPTTYIFTKIVSTERTAAQTLIWEGTSIVIDPLLTNISSFDWTLQADSPCINAGVNVGLTQDFDSVNIKGNPDIGAHEYYSSATYYVSYSSGNDGSTGTTQNTAWKTLAYAQANAISPGDVIALKKGDNWASNLALDVSHGGSSGNYITWDGSLWGTGANAVISAIGNRSDENYSLACITGCKYVTFQNITFDGGNYECYGLVIGGGTSYVFAPTAYQNNERYITIQNCEIKNVFTTGYSLGILIQTWHNDMYNITVQHCNVHDIGSWGIGAYMGRVPLGEPGEPAVPSYCHNLYLGYNTVTDIELSGINDGYSIGLAGGLINPIIEHNIVTQGSGASVAGLGMSANPIDGYHPIGAIFRYNDIRMTHAPCFAVQNGYAQKADIYYNLFYGSNPSQSAIYLMDDTTNPYTGASLNFYNNTIVVEDHSCFDNSILDASVVTFKNNICIGLGTGQYENVIYVSLQANNTTHSNNCLYRSEVSDCWIVTGDDSYYRNEIIASFEATAKLTDPLLTNRTGFIWTLQADSPCINAGVNVAEIPQLDYVGNVVNNPPEIGAYEYGSNPPIIYQFFRNPNNQLLTYQGKYLTF